MDVKGTRLLRTGRPKHDESLTGYIIRLTEQNFYETPLWVMKMAQIVEGRRTSKCAFVFELSESLEHFAELTGACPTELLRLTYPRSSDLNSIGRHLFFDQPIPRYLLRPTYPKICPECLSESNYCRRIWDLSLVTACPKHRCLLIDECPKCKKRIPPIRDQVSICSCKFDWRESSALSVREQEMNLTRHLHRLCNLQIDERKTEQPFNGNQIFSLDLQDFVTAIVFIACHSQGISSHTGLHLMPKGRNNELHTLFTKSYSVFEDWPHNYYGFLNWICFRQKDIPFIRQRQKSPLYMDFGKFYLDLYKTLSANSFDFMRSAFVDYLDKNWKGGCSSNFNREKEAAGCFSEKYVSKTDAIRLLETDSGEFNNLIELGELKSVARSKGKKRLTFIEVGGIVKLKGKSDRSSDKGVRKFLLGT